MAYKLRKGLVSSMVSIYIYIYIYIYIEREREREREREGWVQVTHSITLNNVTPLNVF